MYMSVLSLLNLFMWQMKSQTTFSIFHDFLKSLLYSLLTYFTYSYIAVWTPLSIVTLHCTCLPCLFPSCESELPEVRKLDLIVLYPQCLAVTYISIQNKLTTK